MVRIGRRGVVVDAAAAALISGRAFFEQHHWLKLEGLFDEELLAVVAQGIASAPFEPRRYGDVGAELCLADCPATDLLSFVTNDETFFEVLDELTGCGKIGLFQGRIYQMTSGSEHHDDWHDDVVASRVLAMTVNLSSEPYEGGCLEMREHATRRLLGEVPNLGHGDGILFRLSRDLEHHVTSVSGSRPKTAYAGWFRREPDFRSILTGRARL